MRHFTWDPENEVFLARIDAEHRDIFRIADGLQQAIGGKAPVSEVKQYLHSLMAHAEEHFSYEEWLMQSVKCPSYSWHKQQHDTARRRVKLFLPLIESGDSEAAELFLDFLDGWLQDHIRLTDRIMAANVRNYERFHGLPTGSAAGRQKSKGGSIRRAEDSRGAGLPLTLSDGRPPHR